MARPLQGVLTPAQQIMMGLAGSTLITDTAAHTSEGPWWKIKCKENTIFTTLTDAQRDGNSFVGETFPAGFELEGNFTAITLSSGAVVASKFPSDQYV